MAQDPRGITEAGAFALFSASLHALTAILLQTTEYFIRQRYNERIFSLKANAAVCIRLPCGD